MRRFALAALLPCLVTATVQADEGMWTFDNPPTTAIKQKYQVDITEPWLQRIQRSVTRHESGCTGSFISPEGLVLTNHHCVVQCLANLSNKEQDRVADGFNAKARTEERNCPAEIISVLVDIENVTDKINTATQGLPDSQANDKRKQELGKLEAACTQASQKNRAGALDCESVTLYQGGQYFLYKYKRYDDVRLVFAPHESIAAFGGDPDNFNFPRWCLDFSLLRVYENGKPARTPNHLPWRIEGPSPNEPVFVAGHPGNTNRLLTTAQLAFQRDAFIPAYLNRNNELRGRLIQWSKTGDEPRRIVQSMLQGVENSLKVYRGLQGALLDDAFMNEKRTQEQQLRSRVSADLALAAQTGDPWSQIEAAQQRYREILDRYLYLENGVGFNSKLFGYARQLVRGAAERSKPNEQRLREYADSNLSKIAASLLASTPVYPDFEQLTLSFSLDKMREVLGPDDAIVRKLLGAESPDTLAAALIQGSQLADPKLRERLWEGGAAALNTASDPLIVLARTIDDDARAVRRIYENEVQAPTAAAQEKIAQARFAVLGTDTYPDATFTLRLSYGAVQSWTEKGREVPSYTKLGRLYERATGKAPFSLPKVWLDAGSKLDPDTPFNYVSTNDIVGGNSGSAVVDAQGRLVGLAFDGNIHSIAGNYGYDPRLNRMVAVHPQIIISALRDVYGAGWIAKEILAK